MFASANALAAQVEVRRVWAEERHDETHVILELGAATRYTTFALQDPERIVIDLENASLSGHFEKRRDSVGLVQRIRAAPRHKSDVRVVVDLNRPSYAGHFLQPWTAAHGPRLIVRLRPADVTAVTDVTDVTATERARASDLQRPSAERPIRRQQEPGQRIGEPAAVQFEPGAEASLSTDEVEHSPARVTGTMAASEPERKKENRPEEEVEFDIDAPPRTWRELTSTLTWGGDVELEFEQEANLDLDDSEEDDLTVLESDVELALTHKPNEMVETFLDVSLRRELALQEEGSKRDRDPKLNVKQFNITLRDVVHGLSFKAGRQRMSDEREWLYDDELDAVRAFYRIWRIGLEGSISRKRLFDRDLLDNDDEDEEINNYFVIGRLRPYEDADLALFGMMREDIHRKGSAPIFLGGQLVGEAFDADYWLSFAHVRGKGDFNEETDENDDLNAFGFDVGATYEFDTEWSPSITLAYAFGSGDSDPNDGVDRAFRQTDLQDNSDRFNGVTSFKYYGEVFDPELSNMRIYTVGIGVKGSRKSSIDLVYHHYKQDKKTDELREVGVEEDIPGGSRSLGDELDLVFGYREVKKNLSFRFILGYFFAGSAFGADASDGFLTNMKLRYRF